MNYTLPFTAIVGMDLVKRSLLFHAIDPRLGGLLLMGHRGCAKSTLARAFREILPALETAQPRLWRFPCEHLKTVSWGQSIHLDCLKTMNGRHKPV